MANAANLEQPTRSLIEQFLRDYLDLTGGVWDEIEPQVYDVLLPSSAAAAVTRGAEPELLRVTFDPDALPEHPRAQLASLGTPLIDRLLHDALDRGRAVDLHFVGLNLQPQNVAQRVTRGLKVADGLTLDVIEGRPSSFPQMVFWFEATFTGDQKEQEVVSLAIDLHYGRQVRYLDRLLDPERLSSRPVWLLPEVAGVGRARAYQLAREQAVRTVKALANSRARELSEHIERQAARMTKYYEDLAREMDSQTARTLRLEQDTARLAARQQTLARERDLRIAELRAKSTLSISLRLHNVLVVHQPKLLIRTAVSGGKLPQTAVDAVWDPLVEQLEALPCPSCERPTYELAERRGQLACPACLSAPPSSPNERGKLAGRGKPR